MAKDKILRRDTEVRNRTFSYAKGGTTLNFTLRTDIKEELKNFLEILEASIVDVKKELEGK